MWEGDKMGNVRTTASFPKTETGVPSIVAFYSTQDAAQV